MPRKERWTILLILAACLLAAVLLARQPAGLQGKIVFAAGSLVIPLAILRTGLWTREAFGKRRWVMTALGLLLTGLLFLGLLGEWGKLLALFAG